ncbi:PH domain-containing protein [Kribbella solani]|uniref:PH domain-containing protein n=1 Tax=Kribbella solani TaxID=236067 RepID=A0A841DNU5_9ACTN|nr:PH domain-containing protein [Kribbella solani]MBB5978645.1 hypothetical protein [Kribbella solani]
MAAIVTTAILPEYWPTILVALFLLVAILRVELRLTDEELIFRDVVGTRRIPRAAVKSARFDYRPPGVVVLEIHRYSGVVDRLHFSPKQSSTELSGGPPAVDSAAYQITRWAEEYQGPRATR